jgi:hypothetical protein
MYVPNKQQDPTQNKKQRVKREDPAATNMDVLRDSAQPPQVNDALGLRLRHGRFLLTPYQFIIHQPSYRKNYIYLLGHVLSCVHCRAQSIPASKSFRKHY